MKNKFIILIFLIFIILNLKAKSKIRNYWISPYGLVPSEKTVKKDTIEMDKRILSKDKIPSVLAIPNTTDITLLNGTNITQSENSVFISPVDDDIASVYRIINSNNSSDWQVTTIYGANALRSANAGNTWTGNQFGVAGTNAGDPAVVINRNGRMFVGHMHRRWINYPYNYYLDQYVAYSDDNGQNWTDIAVSTINAIKDKNHLWIDNSCHSQHLGNLYSAWTNFNNGDIEISRSVNNGINWDNSINISNNLNVWLNHGVNIQTGPNGEVYACWAIYDDDGDLNEDAIGFATSVNGGQTWNNARRIFDINGHREIGLGGNKSMRVNSFPSMSVNMQNGNIYIVWTELTSCNPLETDIFIRRSEDGGNNWTNPTRINQDKSSGCNGRDQWFPWISCDEISNALLCIFYDSRNFTNNDRAETFVALSYDNGDNWEDARISDSYWNADGISGFYGNYAGDYLGIDCRYCRAIPVWSDDHTGNMLAYTSPFTLECPENLNLCNATIWEEAMYGVTNTITVAGNNCEYQITDEGMCIMEAGNEIILRDGFHSDNGSFFIARINNDCNSYCRKTNEFNDLGGCEQEHYNISLINNNKNNLSITKNNKSILSAHPNPFTDNIIIQFKIYKTSTVSLRMVSHYGVLIDDIINDTYEPGVYSVEFKPINLSTGNYFIIMNTNEEVFSLKLIYLK
jgi:uncharacterized protein YlzI (FlbEa/FlbD family)